MANRQFVLDWLLDSDPSIRWQVMKHLTGASAEEVAAERARVATEGFGEQLLSLQGPDGSWAGSAWNEEWNSTMHVLTLLRELGLDPASEEAKHVKLVREGVNWRGWDWDGTWKGWDFIGTPFFAGEVEPCINGQVASSGAYFGQDVERIIGLLLGEQQPDGGWNCEAANGSMRSSFNTTICVLESLLEYELAGGALHHQVREARMRGEEYLLERRLLRRRTTGEVVNPEWKRLSFPTWWHYDILRALDYMRRARAMPDERMSEAIELLQSKCDSDGRYPLEHQHPGVMPIELGEAEGQPSRWNTLRVKRVLDWYSGK